MDMKHTRANWDPTTFGTDRSQAFHGGVSQEVPKGLEDQQHEEEDGDEGPHQDGGLYLSLIEGKKYLEGTKRQYIESSNLEGVVWDAAVDDISLPEGRGSKRNRVSMQLEDFGNGRKDESRFEFNNACEGSGQERERQSQRFPNERETDGKSESRRSPSRVQKQRYRLQIESGSCEGRGQEREGETWRFGEGRERDGKIDGSKRPASLVQGEESSTPSPQSLHDVILGGDEFRTDTLETHPLSVAQQTTGRQDIDNRKCEAETHEDSKSDRYGNPSNTTPSMSFTPGDSLGRSEAARAGSLSNSGACSSSHYPVSQTGIGASSAMVTDVLMAAVVPSGSSSLNTSATPSMSPPPALFASMHHFPAVVMLSLPNSCQLEDGDVGTRCPSDHIEETRRPHDARVRRQGEGGGGGGDEGKGEAAEVPSRSHLASHSMATSHSQVDAVVPTYRPSVSPLLSVEKGQNLVPQPTRHRVPCQAPATSSASITPPVHALGPGESRQIKTVQEMTP